MLLHLPRTSPSLPRSLPHPLTLQQSLIHSLLSDVLSHRGPWSYTPSSSLPLRAFKSHARSHLPVASAFNHLTHTHNLLLTFSTRGICRDYFHMKQDKAQRKLLTDGSQAEKNKYIWMHIKHVCVSVCRHQQHLPLSRTRLLFTANDERQNHRLDSAAGSAVLQTAIPSKLHV